MNPEFTRKPHLNLPTHAGTMSNGSRINKPTFVNQRAGTPAPNLHPSFETTPYNNSAQSFMFPMYNTFVANTTNPIGRTDNPRKRGTTGLAGNGSNQNGAGYAPPPMSPYRMEQLGLISGNSQSFPYLSSQLYGDGMLDFHRPAYYGINMGNPETYEQGASIDNSDPSSQESVIPLRTPDQERQRQTTRDRDRIMNSARAVSHAQQMANDRLARQRLRNATMRGQRQQMMVGAGGGAGRI